MKDSVKKIFENTPQEIKDKVTAYADSVIQRKIKTDCKIYIAKYSTGSYDDYYVVNVFVSPDKELVEKWVEKFNTKLVFWKKYFSQFSDNWCKTCLSHEGYNKINPDRFYQIMECNKAFIDETGFRGNEEHPLKIKTDEYKQ